MIGRIDTESLITLFNRFFEQQNSSDMDHLIPRIFQNSGGKPYVPAEVRDQTNTDAAELSHMIMTLPGLDLPLNETRASNNLAVIIPHIKTLNEQIISMLPNEELRKVELFANKSDGELDGIRKSIAGGYVYNIAMKVALELKQKIGADMGNMSDLNVMNMSKLVGAVVLNFPDRIQAGGQNYQEMALNMLADLPAASPGKYDKTLQDCNIWTPAEKEQIQKYSAMNPRERVKAMTTKPVQEIDIKLILASAGDSKEIDALHSKFQKANKDIYSERLHAPLFESAKLAIQPRVGKARSDPTPSGSMKEPAARKSSLGSTAGITDRMSSGSSSPSLKEKLTGLFRSRKGSSEKIHHDPYASEKESSEESSNAFSGVRQYTEDKRPEGLGGENPNDLSASKKESSEESANAFPGVRQYTDDKKPEGLEGEDQSQESGHHSPGMRRSGSGDEN